MRRQTQNKAKRLRLKVLKMVTQKRHKHKQTQKQIQKKISSQIHWKRPYIFDLRAPSFCTSLDSAQYNWGVWDYSKCSKTAFSKLSWK